MCLVSAPEIERYQREQAIWRWVWFVPARETSVLWNRIDTLACFDFDDEDGRLNGAHPALWEKF